MLDLVLPEKPKIFVPETSTNMMAFLVTNVIDHPRKLRVPIRKGTEALLPAKAACNPPIPIDKIGGTVLYIAHQVGQSHGGLEVDQNVRVVRHTMDRQQFLLSFPHNAGHVLVKFFLILLLNQVLAALDGKDDLNVELRIGVCLKSGIMRCLAVG